MNISINPELDFEALKIQFEADKKLRINAFLKPDSARYISQKLINSTPWHLVHSDTDGLPVRYNAEEYAQLNQQQMDRIDNQLHKLAADHYQYKYKFFPIIDAIKAGTLAPSSMLYEVGNFVNSTEFIAFARAITGVDSLVKMDPQASLYESGDFLTMHDDSSYQRSANDQSTRRFAVVLGFTEKWSSNWGGQTSFYSEPNAIESISWNPGFNVLTIFQVPVQHSVNYVTPFAPSGRYSITGWLRDDPGVRRPDLGD
ncbi:MAG: SM-20-related protein [Arenicella sp.]|jgi:SM-20-related protein